MKNASNYIKHKYLLICKFQQLFYTIFMENFKFLLIPFVFHQRYCNTITKLHHAQGKLSGNDIKAEMIQRQS